jgi:hypothetical protein
MLWALYCVPLEKRVGIDGPSVLVEAANGQPLGRVGPLSDAVKRREFPEARRLIVITSAARCPGRQRCAALLACRRANSDLANAIHANVVGRSDL